MKQGFALFIDTNINFSKGFSFDELVTNIIIKKVTSAKEWDEWWKKKLNFTGSVNLNFNGC